MANDNTSIDTLQKSHGKPIDAGAPDKDTESKLGKLTDSGSGMNETQPAPGNEAPGQVAKM